MGKKLIAVLVANLFAGGVAVAQDAMNWQGTVGVGGRWSSVDGDTRNGAVGTPVSPFLPVTPYTGPGDAAKASEYRDLHDAGIGFVDIMGSSSRHYVRAFAENIGMDDQYIDFRAGLYGMLKGQYYSDKTPHNLSWNALTPLANTGGSYQPFPAVTYPGARNPALWNSFNYGIQRNTQGGNVELNANSPFFIRTDYNEVTVTGTRPSSAQLGTGSGNGLIEFGVPTDYTTKNTTIEAGYSGKTWHVKLGYLESKFGDANEIMQWGNPYLRNGLDYQLQPPSNKLSKWSLNANVRSLPWDSTIAARLTSSTLENAFGVVGYGLMPTSNASPPAGSGYLFTEPSSSRFSGEHKTTSASVSWTANPMRGLDTRLYYDYYKKANSSTEIDYAAGVLPTTATGCGSSNATRFCIGALAAGEAFHYKKQDWGLEGSYRWGRQKFVAGVDFLEIDRGLEPAESTKYDKYYVEYRNSMLDSLQGRVKYQYVDRSSELNHAFTNNSSNVQPTSVTYYFTAYDVSNYNQDQIKASIDWSPLSLLNVGVGVTWKKTDYKGLYYGRTKDEATNLDLTVTWGDPNKFRVTGLANWGEVKFDQAYHQGTGPFPGGTQTATDFDWGTKNTQDNWLLGFVVDWVPTEKLALNGSYSYQKTGGGVDFWSGNQAGTGGYLGGPLVNYVTDNTKRHRLNVKADYRFNSQWSATVGYAYEKYEYTDDQMRAYAGYYPYYQALAATNVSWYSGAFANPGYKANTFYLMGKYSFGK
jgi:hypothetical protein